MIRVHEFTTMNGVIDEPRWSFDFGFDPKMGLALAKAMGGCDAILLATRARSAPASPAAHRE
jgi:hypothetical protein